MATVNESFSEAGSETRDGDQSRLAADIESLKKSFTVLRADLAGLVENALGVGKSGASAARDSAADAVDGLKHRATAIKDKGVQSAHVLEQELSDHPVAGILIAFAAGFIIAKMLTRR